MNIYLDIETIPSQSPEVKKEIADGITAPAQYKKQESIDQWLAENRESEADAAWRKTSFDGAYGQIVCISVAIDDAEPVTFWAEDWANYEPRILAEFFKYIEDSTSRALSFGASSKIKPVFIGHYVADFDLRFVFQRAVMLGIKPPSCIPFKAKPWDADVFDTMTEWAGTKGRVSLDKLCKVMGVDRKGTEIADEIDGSKVWDFVAAGRIADVAKYCAADVERTRAVYKRLTFN